MASLENQNLIHELRRSYIELKELPDGTVAGLCRLMYTTAVVLGINSWSWERRFCFEDPAKAKEQYDGLKSEDDELQGWISCRPKIKSKVQEHFKHDDCPKCGTASVPFERVADQAFRGCPNCDHEWFEDLTRPISKGVQDDGDD